MKVLFISDRQGGGIDNHVKCLVSCLPPEAEHYVIGIGGDEDFAGKNGHDIREWFQVRNVMREYKPDVVHFHIPNLFMVLYLRLSKLFNHSTLQSFNLVCSWHTPTNRKIGLGIRLFFRLLGKDCYFLPVSSATWVGLKKWLPYAKGEVFFNSVLIKRDARRCEDGRREDSFVVGMVGRNADQKDWPSFHKVEGLVKLKAEEWAKVEFLNAGERCVCNGRESIAKMDLFVMTSKHEQLPTTVLECFALGTPICGFIPVGGTSDILGFSKGPVREAFIAERDCDKLSDIVVDLLKHPEKRQALVEDGRQILEGHFDAERNVKEQLMRIYGKFAR